MSADNARNNADFWATADESSDQIIGMYRRAWAQNYRDQVERVAQEVSRG